MKGGHCLYLKRKKGKKERQIGLTNFLVKKALIMINILLGAQVGGLVGK